MEQWIKEELSKVLGFDVPDDLIQYIIDIKEESDLNEYMKTLLDFNDPQHRTFIAELVKKKFPKGTASQKQKKKIQTNKPQQNFVTVETPEAAKSDSQHETKDGKKKKTKFLNLYSKEGQSAQVVLLKGRHACNCQAAKHALINNCINCGRIVCEQEGSGPCLFCGELVCTKEEEQKINSNSKIGEKLKGSLMEREKPKGWEEAIALRNRLIENDRNKDKRMQVFDDDSDYFNSNSVWLSPEEREKLDKYKQELHEKKHQSRRNNKFIFDFAGRRITEEKIIEHGVDMNKIQDILDGESDKPAQATEFVNDMLKCLVEERNVAPGVDPTKLYFVDVVKKESAPTKNVPVPSVNRVQDPQYAEMRESRKCLSMHQPWASLLVEGIKLHEGRTWFTNHRGRLWIASTAKPPDPDVVKAVEDQYRLLYPEKDLKFPSFYPTGCLLGCVDVDDCLPQEQYIKQFPDGESDSPFVLICSNPMSLKLRFPIKGQHKIYDLDKTIHTAAVKCLRAMGK